MSVLRVVRSIIVSSVSHVAVFLLATVVTAFCIPFFSLASLFAEVVKSILLKQKAAVGYRHVVAVIGAGTDVGQAAVDALVPTGCQIVAVDHEIGHLVRRYGTCASVHVSCQDPGTEHGAKKIREIVARTRKELFALVICCRCPHCAANSKNARTRESDSSLLWSSSLVTHVVQPVSALVSELGELFSLPPLEESAGQLGVGGLLLSTVFGGRGRAGDSFKPRIVTVLPACARHRDRLPCSLAGGVSALNRSGVGIARGMVAAALHACDVSRGVENVGVSVCPCKTPTTKRRGKTSAKSGSKKEADSLSVDDDCDEGEDEDAAAAVGSTSRLIRMTKAMENVVLARQPPEECYPCLDHGDSVGAASSCWLWSWRNKCAEAASVAVPRALKMRRAILALV